jgi:hypothetical protein
MMLSSAGMDPAGVSSPRTIRPASLPSVTDPVLSSFLRFIRRAWRLGEPTSPIPVYWLVVASMLGTQLRRTIHDVDIFWQLKLGEITLSHGLPPTEPFLAGRENEPLAVVAWLGQAVFAAVRSVGGWDFLRLFDAVIWLGGLAVVGWSFTRQGWNQWVIAVGLWVGWFAAHSFASIRPQTFAVFCFGILVVLVRSGLSTRAKLILGSILFVLWQNLHPSVAVAAVYLAVAAAGEWGRFIRAGGEQPDLARLLLTPIAAAATLATPAGISIFHISNENRDRCVWDELAITEWLPLWEFFPKVGRAQATPMLAATAVLLLVRGRRVRVTDLMPVVALTVMTILTFRFVLFWGVVAIPVWVQGLSPAHGPVAYPTVSSERQVLRRAIVAVGFLLALIPLVILPRNFADYYPLAGVAALKAEHVRGPVYCSYLWGGIVTDFGYPDWHPTHDGRYYLFTREELSHHFAAGRGEVPLSELERQFRPVAYFLLPGRDDYLALRLRGDPAWREVHADQNCFVFVRR